MSLPIVACQSPEGCAFIRTRVGNQMPAFKAFTRDTITEACQSTLGRLAATTEQGGCVNLIDNCPMVTALGSRQGGAN